MASNNSLDPKSKSLMQNSLLYYRHYKTTIVTNPRIFPRIGDHNTASKEPLRHFLRIHKTVLATSSSSDYLLENYSKLWSSSHAKREIKIAVHMYLEQRQHYSPAMLEFKSLQTVLNSMRDTAVHTDSGPWSHKMEGHDQKL